MNTCNTCKSVKPHNDLLNIKFLTEYEAGYHYIKHKEFGSRIMSIEEYFGLAENIISNSILKQEETFTQEGDSKRHIFFDAETNFRAVVVTRLESRVSVLATLMYCGKKRKKK